MVTVLTVFDLFAQIEGRPCPLNLLICCCYPFPIKIHMSLTGTPRYVIPYHDSQSTFPAVVFPYAPPAAFLISRALLYGGAVGGCTGSSVIRSFGK